MAQLMAQQFKAEPGNYLAFFSSFDYLQQALDRLRERHPELPLWAQSRGMSEPERAAFIERFCEGGEGIGFAVLGGAFGEGIDLPGRRLIGAFIATLGLPQVNPVNERLRARLQAWFGHGYEYAYLYPGLQKVAQAAGRVIRSEADRGTVWLLDDRFAPPRGAPAPAGVVGAGCVNARAKGRTGQVKPDARGQLPAGSAGASGVISTWSMRRPSSASTSKRQPAHSTDCDSDISSPATVCIRPATVL